MKIILNGKETEVLTIKELYELALAEGKENAVLGMNCEYPEVQKDDAYTEEIAPDDVQFSHLYNSNGTKVCDAIWLNNHELKK
jgi:hypothetical protein